MSPGPFSGWGRHTEIKWWWRVWGGGDADEGSVTECIPSLNGTKGSLWKVTLLPFTLLFIHANKRKSLSFMIDLKSLSSTHAQVLFSSDIFYGLFALIIKIVSDAFDQWTHNPAFNFCHLYEVHLVQEWCWRTESSPVSMAVVSFFFHCSATSFARGSSGLGALNNAWIESNTVRICRAGDHLSEGRGVQTKFRSHWENQGKFEDCTAVVSAQTAQQPQLASDGCQPESRQPDKRCS